MAQKSMQPMLNARSVVIFEVMLDGASPSRFLDVITSIAGREGTQQRRWHLSGGVLDEAAAEDVYAYVASSVQLGITTMLGVQTALPLS